MTQGPSSTNPPIPVLGGGLGAPVERPVSTGPADGDDTQRFGDLMKGGEQPAGERRDEERPAPPDPKQTPFDLFGPPTGQKPAASVAAPGNASPNHAPDLGRIAEAVVQRLLVSEGMAPGDQEVRIQLKESVLPGTEIRIRTEGGRLVVEFVCTNADSVRFLDTQREPLAAHLDGRLKTHAEVLVTPARDGEFDDRQDGRSRQRYVPADDSGGDAQR